MATTIQNATTQLPPEPVRLVLRIRTCLVVTASLLPALEPSPEDCVDCGQTAVAFDSHGLGWCNAHAPLELLCH